MYPYTFCSFDNSIDWSLFNIKLVLFKYIHGEFYEGHTLNLRKWIGLAETFDDAKGVIRRRKSKDRQHNDQKEKRTNNLHNATQKTNKSYYTNPINATRNQEWTQVLLKGSSWSMFGTRRVTFDKKSPRITSNKCVTH